MAETKTVTASYRISDDLKAKIADLMSSEKLSADSFFTALVAAFEKENFGSSAYGQAMSNDMDAWAMHSAALQQLYYNAVRSGVDAKTIAAKELTARIETAEAARSGLEEKMAKMESEKKDLADQLAATQRSLEESLKSLDKAEAEADKADANAETWKNSINTLTVQLKGNQDKVKNFDQVSAELAKVKADLMAAKAENKALSAVIDKYMYAK